VSFSGTAIYSLLLLVGLVLLWQLLTAGSQPLLDPLIFSRPGAVLKSLLEYASSGTLLLDLSLTLSETLIGLALGLGTGILVGMFLGKYELANNVLSPYLIALNSLPRPALAPVLIVWFGVGLMSKIFLAWSLVFFVVLFNTLYGIRMIDPDYIRSMKVMGASESQIARIVTVPSVMSWIFAAFRTSVSLALIGAVVGEFVGAQAGLGYRIVISAGLFEMDRVYVILFLLMVIGSVLVFLAERVERFVLRWRPGSLAPE
jgi:sulfonate transport system permease protein